MSTMYLPTPDEYGSYVYPDGASIFHGPRTSTWRAKFRNSVYLKGCDDTTGEERVWNFSSAQEAADAFAGSGEGPDCRRPTREDVIAFRDDLMAIYCRMQITDVAQLPALKHIADQLREANEHLLKVIARGNLWSKESL